MKRFARAFPVRIGAAALALLCLWLVVASGGCARRVSDSSEVSMRYPGPRIPYSFDSAIYRFAVGENDSFVVVAFARNVSRDTLRLCCRFDFEGGFSPGACPSGERPPFFLLVSRAAISSAPLQCREVSLAPGAVFADSVSFRLYRPDFARCPGRLEIRGAFWAGEPGQSFAQAALLVPHAVEVTIDEP